MTQGTNPEELSLGELGDAIERGEREPAEAVARLKAAVIYPRYLGTDPSGSDVWELENGRWTFADTPWQAVHMTRTFEPERYVGKYGVPS
jgi:hypothetical protein